MLDAIRDPHGFDVLVVELSSYQLHWINRNAGGVLAPLATVCLNLADDHLDWHGSREAYRDAKAKVYENTRVACVYNLGRRGDPRDGRGGRGAGRCRAIGFGLGVPGPSDVGLVDGILVDRAFLDDRRTSALELATMDDLAPSGLGRAAHAANVLAAAALARAAGCQPARDPRRDPTASGSTTTAPRSSARAAASLWVDDSKATNAHAADAALSGFRLGRLDRRRAAQGSRPRAARHASTRRGSGAPC